jgi:hypothetical protein
MGQAESAADQPAARKHVLNFLGRGAGGHIKVLWHLAKQQIANTATHQKCLETCILQIPDDFSGVRAEFFQPNPVFGLRNDEKVINIVLRVATG